MALLLIIPIAIIFAMILNNFLLKKEGERSLKAINAIFANMKVGMLVVWVAIVSFLKDENKN